MIIVNMSNPWVMGSLTLAGIGFGLLLVWCLISKHNTKEGRIALLLILISLGCHTIYTSKNWQYVQNTRGRVLVDLPAHGMFVTTGAYVLFVVCNLGAGVFFVRDVMRRRKSKQVMKKQPKGEQGNASH